MRSLAVIIKMYNGIKSLIEKDRNLSDTFPCNIGVRQGENLSPLLFAIYLNDLETSLYNLGISPLYVKTLAMQMHLCDY